jgi:hypothetical protein
MITYRDHATAARDPDLDFLFGDDPSADYPLTSVSTVAQSDRFRRLCWIAHGSTRGRTGHGA